MATHFSILAWEIPWTEESGGLQSMGLQKSWTQLSPRGERSPWLPLETRPDSPGYSMIQERPAKPTQQQFSSPILQLPTQKLQDGLTAQGIELASGPVAPEVPVAVPLTPFCLSHVSCSQNLSRSLFCTQLDEGPETP